MSISFVLCLRVGCCKIAIRILPTPAMVTAINAGVFLSVVLLFAVVVEKFPLEYLGVKPLSRGI